ncbi:hypothetical protein D3C80_1003820 [compost metagenome]
MVDVFEQVEEELRSERYKRLARTWLPVLAGVLAVALIAALAWWGWQTYVTSQADKASAAYEQGVEAMQAGKAEEAKTAFAASAEAGGGYKALALMQQAGIALSENKTTEAVALFDEAAKAAKDPILSDIAVLKATFLVMDTASLEDVRARLEPLTGDKRPMSAFAQEALAMAQLQHGKTADARQVFVQLQLGQDVPDSVRQRAQAAVQAIDTGTASNLAAIVKAAAALSVPTASPALGQAPVEASAAPAQAPAPAPAP